MDILIVTVVLIVVAFVVRAVIISSNSPATEPPEDYILGYQDMAYSLYLNNDIPYGPDLSFSASRGENGEVSLNDSRVMEYFSNHRAVVNGFDPSQGRINTEIMSGEDDERWNRYYAGGTQFLEDLRAFCAGEDKKSRLIESRRMGAKEIDAQFKPMDQEDFDKKMEELLRKEK